MPRFSLIVATIGRTQELQTLLRSLEEQQLRDFELIVVDQNPDHRLTAILQDWTAKLAQAKAQSNGSVETMHLRCAAGVSPARNLGIRHSSGEFLAFPDDDCWYQPDALSNIDQWFMANPQYEILSLSCRDERRQKSGND